MRVLHIQKASGIGGSERHLLTLLPALAAEGLDVRMAILAAGDWERFARPLREAGVDTVTIPAGPNANPALVARLVRELRRWKADVVHTHLIHADLHGQLTARLARVPAVQSVHSTNPFYRHPPGRTAARTAGLLARRTIAISRHVARFLARERLARPERIRTVHYGIDATGWPLDDAEREHARGALDLSGNDVAVGVASRLFPFKGHDVLIDAFARAVERAPALRLLVAGEGVLRPQLERRAAACPPESVRFLGHVDDVRTFIGACDVLAFPTQPGFGEGFGLAALEGSAAGRPVVATAIDSLPEIVEDGETGVLVPPGDPAALADSLVLLAEDPVARRRMGAAAAERAASEFTVERMVRGTLDVYAEVLREVRA